jgi:hypothetical protein
LAKKPHRVSQANTSCNPALAPFAGRLNFVWKDAESTDLWLASMNKDHELTEPNPLRLYSSHGPALTPFNGNLYLALRGSGDDTRVSVNRLIFSNDGHISQPHKHAEGRITHRNRSITVMEDFPA